MTETQINPITVKSDNIFSAISVTKTTYHILGEDYEIESSYQDIQLSNVIATLNVLGEPYWRELKKNNVYFDEDLDKFIEKKLKQQRRDNNISEIIGTK